MLQTFREDFQAVLDNDAAARSTVETVLAPSPLHAIWVYRVAHALHEQGLPWLPRKGAVRAEDSSQDATEQAAEDTQEITPGITANEA